MRKVGCLILKAGLVLFLVALASTAILLIRLWPHARAAYTAGQDLRLLRGDLRGWPTRAEVARVQRDIVILDESVQEMEALLRPTYPLLRRMAPLPRYGPAIASLPDLMVGGTSALHAGRLLLEGLAPAFPPKQPDSLQDLLPPFLAQITEEDARLAEAEVALDEASAAFARVPTNVLPDRTARDFARGRELMYLGRQGITLLRLAPTLLGANRERVWLVLAQNNEELRPTGGFISAAGAVRVRNGQVGEIAFVDSYRLFSPRHAYPRAPRAMREALKTDLLLFRDANWWPDVPTSARVLARFYAMETGTRVDGLVFLDLDAVRLLVEGMGGVRLPDGTRVNGDNLLPYFYRAWSSPSCPEGEQCTWWTERKRFLNDVAAAVMARIQNNPRGIPPLTFARHLVRALDERHLLVVPLSDPKAAALVAARGWDGAIRPGAGDYLRITDTNVGFNKANARVRLSIAYVVDVRDPSAPTAELRLTYRHTAPPGTGRCYQIAYYGLKYEDMQNRCYWNFLRVNTVPGVTLLERHGFRAGNLTVAAGDAGTTEFSGLIVVPPGERHQVTLRYELPLNVIEEGLYHLRVQKQPGMHPVPFVFTVKTDRGNITGRLTLRTDVDITVSLENVGFEVQKAFP